MQVKDVTVREFLDEYVEVYGLKEWGNSFYSMKLSLIKNYINPCIGDRYVRSITVRDIDAYYTMLLDKPAVVVSGHMDTGATISAHTVSRIHKLLKSAFAKAVVWEYTKIIPTIGATLPEHHFVEVPHYHAQESHHNAGAESTENGKQQPCDLSAWCCY